MPRAALTPDLLDLIADRFRVLAEPARLQLLNVMRDGELSVGELVDRTGLGQANTSKHLQLLRSHGFVDRRKEGLYVFYRIADPEVFQLCEVMCDHIERHSRATQELFSKV
jgi:ArsR family transcriptional regulator